MSQCQCEERSEHATAAADTPQYSPTSGSCGYCQWKTVNGHRTQVSFCSAGCACHDYNTPQSSCLRVTVPTADFAQCCIDAVRENLRLAREARLFAWLGAAIAIGAIAFIYSGPTPRREVARPPA